MKSENLQWNTLKKVAREKKKLLVLNEKITRDFEIKPRNEHSISEEEYNRAKQEIEKLHSEKTKGYILRSKCQIFEEGEKPKFVLHSLHSVCANLSHEK